MTVLKLKYVGWGAEYESWGIQYSVLYGDTSNLQHQVWADLDAFLAQTFQKPDGTRMKIICTCVDSGGHRTNQVYKFCKARFNRRIFAIKGSNDSAAAIYPKPTKSNREQAYLFTLGVDTGKAFCYSAYRWRKRDRDIVIFRRKKTRDTVKVIS